MVCINVYGDTRSFLRPVCHVAVARGRRARAYATYVHSRPTGRCYIRRKYQVPFDPFGPRRRDIVRRQSKYVRRRVPRIRSPGRRNLSIVCVENPTNEKTKQTKESTKRRPRTLTYYDEITVATVAADSMRPYDEMCSTRFFDTRFVRVVFDATILYCMRSFFVRR